MLFLIFKKLVSKVALVAQVMQQRGLTWPDLGHLLKVGRVQACEGLATVFHEGDWLLYWI